MTSRERLALAVSFGITSILGVSFLCGFWLHQGLVIHAVVRSILFVAVMGVVHLAGARLYVAQQLRGAVPGHFVVFAAPWPPVAETPAVAHSLSRAILIALVQQAALLILSAMILDIGFGVFRGCLTAVGGHWVAILAVLSRRRRHPHGWTWPWSSSACYRCSCLRER